MTAPQPVRFTRAGFVGGARACLPFTIGTIPFGLVCGIAAQGAGLSMLEAGLMSAFCYAGSAQLVSLTIWTTPAPILAVAIATFTVNLRMALMGPVLSPWFDRLRGLRLWGTLFFMADQNWALSVKEMNAGRNDAAFLLGSGVLMWVVWVATTLIGHVAGAVLRPPPGHPVFFAALALFISVLVNMWRGPRDIVPWIVAAGVAVLTARILPGGSYFIVAGALAGSVVGGLRDHARREAATAGSR